MKELVNFIPKSFEECRELLVALRNHPDGVEIPDRYGEMGKLGAIEIKALVKLIENQIGEKTSKAEPKRDYQRPVTRPSNKKTVKK